VPAAHDAPAAPARPAGARAEDPALTPRPTDPASPGNHLPDIAGPLVAWFERGARDLPWRKDRTGYRVWVSEVMLQQTRVSTVIPYYERFLGAFPSVAALAAAEVGQVLAMWSGLGYYRRARALHEGAREVVARHAGALPPTAAGLRQIKGIGAYTAGAIASLAYGERTPVVDGNVVRVICRLFAIEEDARKAAAQRRIWSLCESLLPAQGAGAFNEALMELGATVCSPRDPTCLLCPLSDRCEARRLGAERRLPLLSPPRAAPTVRAAAMVCRSGGKVLLGRRRADALFGGLWEPPMIEFPDGTTPLEAAAGFCAEARVAGELEHVLTHRRMAVTVLVGVPARGAAYPAVYEELREVAEVDLGSYGVSTLARKVLRAAAAPAAGAARRQGR
jgi:A/G-specific adenine glycosylase